MIVDPSEAAQDLQVAVDHEDVFIRMRGRASFIISPALKQFGNLSIDRGRRRFVLDLRECTNMDSTFMGVLAGLALRLKALESGALIMMNIPPNLCEAVFSLGLDQLIACYRRDEVPAALQELAARLDTLTRLDTAPANPRATAETMLEAHTNLIKLSVDNLPRFKDVLTCLKDELKDLSKLV